MKKTQLSLCLLAVLSLLPACSVERDDTSAKQEAASAQEESYPLEERKAAGSVAPAERATEDATEIQEPETITEGFHGVPEEPEPVPFRKTQSGMMDAVPQAPVEAGNAEESEYKSDEDDMERMD